MSAAETNPIPTPAVGDAQGATLRVLSGPSLQTGAEIVLIDARITLGSDPTKASVVLENDIKVSRLHAFIQREGEDYLLYDAESVSGTIVNGQPLTRGHPLLPGDRIQIGDTVLTFTRRHAWGSKSRGLRDLMPEFLAVAVILGLVAGALYFLPEAQVHIPTGTTIEEKVDSLVPRDAAGFVDWKVSTFDDKAKPNPEEVTKHYRRAMRAYQDISLDPSNAFTAIMEFRRAKAYNFGAAKTSSDEFQPDKADECIAKCVEYIKFQQRKYWNGFLYAYKLGDNAAAAACLRRLMAMFQDRFYAEIRAQEYAKYDRLLHPTQ